MTMLRSIALWILSPVFAGATVVAQVYELDLDWPQPNGTVLTTALSPNGETLYVGGVFTTVNGIPRQNLAAIDVATRSLTSWAPSTNDMVFEMLALGDSVIVTGSFTTVNGAGRTGLGSISATTGATGDWNPVITYASTFPIIRMTATQDRLFVGGLFDSVNGQVRTSVACFEGPTGALSPWSVQLDYFDLPRVYDLQLNGDAIILFGEFTNVNGAPRIGVIEVDQLTAVPTSFDLGVNSFIFRTVKANGSLYLLGGFSEILGTMQSVFARVQLPTPQLLAWSPPFTVPQPANLAATPDGILHCGESFTDGPIQRSCITLFDGNTGAPTGTMPMLLGNTKNVLPLAGSWILGGAFQLPDQPTAFTLVGLRPCNPVLFFADLDGDGLGDPGVSLSACSAPLDHVPNADDCDDSDPLIGTASTWFFDGDGDDWGDASSSLISCTQPVGYALNDGDCDDTDPLVYPLAPCDDGDPLTVNDAYGNTNSCECNGSSLTIHVRMYLEGPYLSGIGHMREDLRVLGLLPTNEPYSALGYSPAPGSIAAGTVAPPERFSAQGLFSVVDWVVVELRDPSDPQLPVSTRYLLLLMNGDVVDLDGGPPRFPVSAGLYHVAVLHRNHLGLVTQNAIALGDVPPFTTVDLTSASLEVFGGPDARKVLNGISMLPTGDVTFNDGIQYVGQGNDRDPILLRIGGSIPTNTVSGYFQEDVNLDGIVRYAGALNDRDPVLSSIGGSTPQNIRPNNYLRSTP